MYLWIGGIRIIVVVYKYKKGYYEQMENKEDKMLLKQSEDRV